MKSCCQNNVDKKFKRCTRKKDNKIFKLPRKLTQKRCLAGVKGFSAKSSCAPYKYCKKTRRKKKSFLFNPNDPDKSFDVYIDKNPKDTIPIRYKTLDDVKTTITKLENLYRDGKYTHKRIWQVGMIMKVRLEVIKKRFRTKDITKRYNLAKRYFYFLRERTKRKTLSERISMIFKI
jgi:hypothetical protein